MSAPGKNDLPNSIAIIFLIFGTIFVLSGACTGILAWEAEFSEGGGYRVQKWYEAAMFGSIALVPSGLMLWAAIRQTRRGNNKVSGVIFTLAGICILLTGLLFVLYTINTMQNYREEFSSSIIMLNNIMDLFFPFIITLTGAWLLLVGMNVLRIAMKKEIMPEIFD